MLDTIYSIRINLAEFLVLMGNSPEICKRHYAELDPETMADTVEFTLEIVGKNTSKQKYES